MTASDPPRDEPTASSPRSWSTTDTAALVTLTLLGGLLRLWRVGVPPREVFDESFYARDSCHYATGLLDACGMTNRAVEVHPPMGKWLISGGIRLFGYDPFGSRIVPVIAGTLLIAVVYLIARRLFRNTRAAGVAGLFVALDTLLLVHSRTAMLEIFIPLFLSLAFLFALYDKDSAATDGAGRPRRWRLLAGVALGCAMATKWSAGPVLIALPLVALAWELQRGKDQGVERRAHRVLRQEGLSLLAAYVIVPAAVYIVSYFGRVHGDIVAWPGDATSWCSAFWYQQRFMWDYFTTPRTLHSYQSEAWTWLFSRHAFPYYFEYSAGKLGGVIAAGSPVMWLPVIPATGWAIARWIQERSTDPAVVIPLVGFAATYGLWLVPSLFGYEHFFLYYLTQAIPFIALLVAGALNSLETLPIGRRVSTALVTSWVLLFAFLYPLFATVGLSPVSWRARADFYQLCPVPQNAIKEFELSRLVAFACNESTRMQGEQGP